MLYVANDTRTHEIIATELSLSTVTDEEILPNLLKQTRRNMLEVFGDGAYDRRACHAASKIKPAVMLIPQYKKQSSGSTVILEFSQWVARSYTAQIGIGKSGIDTTDVCS